MSVPEIKNCPSTLKPGYNTYAPLALKKVFAGKKVSHILPYSSPTSQAASDKLFTENRKRISISGVQEKFSVLLEKNKLRLINEGEQGMYILKPKPEAGKHPEQMAANEHLSMQIAKQVFNIETAENALIFFEDGSPAYITKRFDLKPDGTKWAQEDFASIAGRSPQTHGENYKYLGNYLELFGLMKKYVPAYSIETPKLFALILYNYLISNGDAHFKNFSLIETPLGDFKLSPAYDLLNSRIHIDDKDFALDEGLLPPQIARGKIQEQFFILGTEVGLTEKQIKNIFSQLTSKKEHVVELIDRSYLSENLKRNYEQAYLTRLKKITKT